MKKIICLLLTAAVIFSLSACARGEKTVNIADQTDVMNRVTAQSTQGTAAPAATRVKESSSFAGAVQKKDGTSPTVRSALTPPGKTFTGLPPLPAATFEIHDPGNSRGLSTEKTEFGFGIAKNGKPHEISVNNQRFYDRNGYRAVCMDTESSGKVLYLTFDCGYENGMTASILDTLKAKNVPAAFFCTLSHIKDQPELIARMIREGHIVGNHSATHADFSALSREEMAREILECDSYLRLNFGYTSPYFRFPEGSCSDCALELVTDLGYTSVFWSLAYTDWNTDRQQGAEYARSTVISRLHPGAIILLHAVSRDNAQAMGSIIDEARSLGYEFLPLTALPG